MRLVFPPAGLALAALLAACPALARAGEIAADSKIEAVTVYPDAATVSRVAELDLPAGDSILVFKALPLALDPDSLRVSGEGGAKIMIGSVESALAPGALRAPDGALAVRLANLREEREGVRASLAALEAKRAMILRYSQASPSALSSGSKPLDITQWGQTWDMVAAALAKVGADLRPVHDKARALDEEIKALEAQNGRPTTGAPPVRTARVALSADAPTHARITLSYRMGGVGWRPAYDAALDTTGTARTVSLTRRALISQRTGEDWSGVALTVSTARVAGSVDAPQVEPELVDFWRPPVLYAAPAGAMAKTAQARAAPEPAPEAAQEVAALAQSSAYGAQFKVAGEANLPSDGAQKSFVLARASAPAALVVKAAPGLDPTAYLEAHLTNAGDAPLLAGEISLHRDGAYVGQSRVGFVAPGEGFDLGFGADDKIKITRAPVNEKENEPVWYNQTKIVTRDYKTTIVNLHDFPVTAQVVDRAPYSQNTAITTELLPQTTAPTVKDVAGKRGVMSWTLDLAPGQSREIRLAYRLKWPADREVTLGGR